jgi:predicted transposase YbfD/YdcC
VISVNNYCKIVHCESVYEVFTSIPDPRSTHGLRYELAYLLTCLVAGLLCNADSTLAIAKARVATSTLCSNDSLDHAASCVLPIPFIVNSSPLDAEQIEWALADWICSTLVAEPEDPIALDGKTVRGARTDKQVAPHLLSFRTHQSQETLLQVVVSEKTNEIPVAQALLPCLPLAGRVCSADALHTQKDFMQCVDALGGKSVLTVKNDQPTLFADLATYFADPYASFFEDATLDLHRGRIEKRSIRVSTEMNAYLKDWPLVEQVAELTRTITVRKTGKTSQEVVYLITPLTTAQASPRRLLDLVRGHWSIENSSRLPSVMSPLEKIVLVCALVLLLATLRNLAITLIHRSGSSQIAVTRRHFASHPRQAFSLLLPKKLSQQ